MPRKRKRRRAIPPTVSVLDTTDYSGWCDRLDPHRPIWVNPRESDRKQFEVLLHEWVHRYFDLVSEPKVLRLARDLERAAHRLFIIKRRKKA